MTKIALTSRALVAVALGLATSVSGCTDDGDPGSDASSNDAGDAGNGIDSGTAGGHDGGALDASSALFTGAPTCDNPGLQLQGSVGTTTVNESADRQSAGAGTDGVFWYDYNQHVSDGGSLALMQLRWQQAPTGNLIVQAAESGYLITPSTGAASTSYCIEAAEFGLAASQPSAGSRILFRITSLKINSGSSCDGAPIAADLRGCVYTPQ